MVSNVTFVLSLTRKHNVAGTSLHRRCNVTTLQRRYNDVVATLSVCWVLVTHLPGVCVCVGGGGGGGGGELCFMTVTFPEYLHLYFSMSARQLANNVNPDQLPRLVWVYIISSGQSLQIFRQNSVRTDSISGF